MPKLKKSLVKDKTEVIQTYFGKVVHLSKNDFKKLAKRIKKEY